MSTRLSHLVPIALLAAFGVGVLPVSAFAQGSGRDSKSTQSRIQKKTYLYKEADKEMEYALFVPSGYEKGKKSPLMVALHGLNSNPRQILHYRGLTDLAEKHGYLVVAPMGYNEQGWYGSRVLGRRNQPENLAELSEKDVMNVLEIVRKEYTIDQDRMYLMGHSMGGAGTLHLGIKYPDLWAALAPIAPAINRPASDAAKLKSIPIIIVAGDEDRLVPVAAVRRWADQMKQLGMKYEYLEIEGGNHISVAFDGMPKIFEFFNKQKRTPQESTNK